MTGEQNDAIGKELFVTITDESSTGGSRVTRMVVPGEGLSTTLAMMVADVLDEDPTELTPRLYDLVDPEALDGLFSRRGGGSDVRAELELYGCAITVERREPSPYELRSRRSAVDPPENRASGTGRVQGD